MLMLLALRREGGVFSSCAGRRRGWCGVHPRPAATDFDFPEKQREHSGAVRSAQRRNAFERFGPITDARVMMDAATQKSRGFAFVTFDHVEVPG